jgi:hypothetical protein
MAQSTRQYFKDYFEESNKINDSFEVTDSKGNVHIFDRDQVLREILAMPNSTQKRIRTKFAQIDYVNGDINNFINYMLKGLVK